MGKKKKETEDIFTINKPLELRPEQVIKYIKENGCLPDDFNPYGDYKVDRSYFMGDTKPTNPNHVGINVGDPDLIPIYISSPSPPKLELIDGYTRHKDDQYWRRPEVPISLKKVEEKALYSIYEIEIRNRQETVQGYKLYQKYWDILEQEQGKYAEEIRWIKHQWWYRINGYWVFIDGVPSYLTGDYYDYLTYWYIKESEIYPDFREEDRIISIFSKYLEETTETFAELDRETGRAAKREDGTYEMVDIGGRTFFGEMIAKFRRAGETQRGCHKVWKGTSTMQASYGTIISMEGDNAEKHYYKKLIPAWNKYPMFLKPIWMGSKRPTAIRMIEPPNVFHLEGLGSTIDYTGSAGVAKNDGDTLHFSLMDEEGKDSRASIFERWNVNKMAMSRGGGTNIIGYSMHPSTVEEMGSAGQEFYNLAQLSCFYERMPVTGQTYSGLARIFIPAYKKLEGYIDRWGKSVVDTPTERQIKYSPRAKFAITGKGAKETLQSQLDSLLIKGTPEALEAYRSRRRKFPMQWADCWLGSAGSVGFNLEILDKRMGEINREKSFGRLPYKVGNLRRIGDKDSDVVFEENRETGKFKISMDLPKELTNRRTQEMGFDASQGMFVPMWKPIGGDHFTMGADPFQYMNKNLAKLSMVKSRQSDGGLAILYNNGKEKHFVLSYRNRPASQYEYMEDAIMACQYFCCMCYPETNINDLWKHFIERGYGGYLLYQIDIKTGKLKDKPGEFTGLETRDGYFTAVKDYIEFYGAYECHDDILKEFRDIQGPDAMTHYDLFTAAALALRGDMTRYRQVMEMQNSMTIDLDGIGVFRKRRF